MSNLTLTPEMQAHMTNIIGLISCHKYGGVWNTANADGIVACEKFVQKGWALEVTALHVDPNLDPKVYQTQRCWQLTIKGRDDNQDMVDSMRTTNVSEDEQEIDL